jgi:4-alpha-glucanotransferase
LAPLIDWAAARHLRLIQLLPMGEGAPGETSPYQAWSGFALDPVYLSIPALTDFVKTPEASRLLSDGAIQEDLSRWRASDRVCYEPIRGLKRRLLDLCFESFYREEWLPMTPRGRSLKTFIRSKPWMNDYALFRLLKERFGWRHWMEWPTPYRDRDPRELEEFSRNEEKALVRIGYVQWLASEQWEAVRAHAERNGVRLMGDLPFLVSRDSADVWSHPNSFSASDSVGAPPDAFNADGQSWGLPAFRWEVMEGKGFPWWRLRIREARGLYHLIRLDHVVGFFRIWLMPKEGTPRFEPEEEPAQIARGEKLLGIVVDECNDCVPVAEDLGVIPEFVHPVLEKFRIAGHKVLRWQKREGEFIDPKDYPFVSLATTGTHDTSTLAVWWKETPEAERRAFLKMLAAPEVNEMEPFSDRLNRAILDRLLGSGSALAVFPFQDLFGLPDQINVPATVDPRNWTWRMPVNIDDLERTAPFSERGEWIRGRIDHHGR